MAAVGRTAAFSFTGILTFAAVVTGLATAFAFTGVLSFAGMNVLLAFVGHLLERSPSLARGVGSVRLDGERTSHQAGNRRAREDGCWFHIVVFRFGLFTRTGNSSRMIRGRPRQKEYGRTGRADADKATCGNRKND